MATRSVSRAAKAQSRSHHPASIDADSAERLYWSLNGATSAVMTAIIALEGKDRVSGMIAASLRGHVLGPVERAAEELGRARP